MPSALFSGLGMFGSYMEGKAAREAAKDNARRQELSRESLAQRNELDRRRRILEFNQAARERGIDRYTAQDVEGAREYQAQQAADALQPRAALGLGAYTPGFEARLMQDVSTTPVNPLTGGTPWANALAAQQAVVRGERMLDAKDMAALEAGNRRTADDAMAMSKVQASITGEGSRIRSMGEDAGVAKSDVSSNVEREQGKLFGKEAEVERTYAPWVGQNIVQRGSIGDIARMGKDLSDQFKPATPSVPAAGSSPLSDLYKRTYGSPTASYGGKSLFTAPGGSWT